MKFSGTIYLNGNRYWLKTKLPGAATITHHALKPTGSRFATKDRTLAVMLAEEIWRKSLMAQPVAYDGRLATLASSYVAWARKYYLPPSRTAESVQHAVLPLARETPDLMAEDFTPLHLKGWRELLITRGTCCRSIINRHVRMIQRMFRWGASEMMVSVHVHAALCTLDGLRQGRTAAREGKKILPVPADAIEAVLAHLSTVLADVVRVQVLTGMRPGEVLAMRPCDIDRSGALWLYQPAAHKTQYLGHGRAVMLGPRAQAVLNPYLDNRAATDYCFKPTESNAQGRLRMRLARRTPLSYGNRVGTNCKGAQEFGECFDTDGYRKAIRRACRAAGIAIWHPHQLRHTAATNIRREFGLDAARAVLGHRSVCVTNEYAELDLDKAAQVARMQG